MKVYPSHKVNMGAIQIDQPLPQVGLDQIDPFLLIHHWSDEFAGNQHPRDLGVGPHPHRGFSPVTVIFEGAIHHRDSLGTSSIVGAGGVQWMVAGKGITHSERPPAALADEGGKFEIIQFWVNLPQADKMRPPVYHAMHSEDIPTREVDGVRLAVIAGEWSDVQSALQTPHAVDVYRLDFGQDTQIELTLRDGYDTALYQLDGAISVNDNVTRHGKHLYHIPMEDSRTVHIHADQATRVLLLSGRPLNEKVSQYGPFVMNNQREIMEAIRDAQIGKMGVLIEEFDTVAR